MSDPQCILAKIGQESKAMSYESSPVLDVGLATLIQLRSASTGLPRGMPIYDEIMFKDMGMNVR